VFSGGQTSKEVEYLVGSAVRLESMEKVGLTSCTILGTTGKGHSAGRGDALVGKTESRASSLSTLESAGENLKRGRY
jgi:hypothetical protein